MNPKWTPSFLRKPVTASASQHAKVLFKAHFLTYPQVTKVPVSVSRDRLTVANLLTSTFT